jgi:hypothetical protein
MTLDLLSVSATGGALLGYGVRARQYLAIGRKPDAPAGVLPGKSEGQGHQPEAEKGAREK